MKLIKDDGYSKAVDPVVYQSMVGSLIYAAIATRPDIAQAVGALAKFNPSPNQAHLTAVKRVFRYLKGTVKLHLSYEARDKVMGRYSDADWLRQSCKDLQIHCFGSITIQGTIAQGTIAQGTIAQGTIAQGTIAQGTIAQGTIAQGTIAMSKNPILHKLTKHIDFKFHFVREKIQDKTIQLKYGRYFHKAFTARTI